MPWQVRTWCSRLLLVPVLAFFACKTDQSSGITTVRSLAWWDSASPGWSQQSGPRLIETPSEVLEHIQAFNKATGYDVNTKAISLDSSWKADIHTAWEGIPEPMRKLLSKRLVALMAVRNLGSSGLAESVLDSSGAPVAGWFVFDADVLNRAANDWCSWRESTSFQAVSGWTMRCVVAPPSQDNRATALRLILMHELAHILAIGTRIHPDWDLPDSIAVARFSNTTFPLLGWARSGSTIRGLWDNNFTDRVRISYYGKSQIPLSQSPAVYAQLSKTGYPSLYGAMTPYEDFAESVMHYAHVHINKGSFELEVRQGDSIRLQHKTDWSDTRLATRKRFLDSLFGNPLSF